MVAVKRLGSLDAVSREFASEYSERLWKQLVVAPDAAAPANKNATTAIALAIPFSAITVLLLSLALHRWIASRHRFPLILAAVLWLVGIMILQRPNPWAKVWLYLYPLILIWASAGILGLVQDFYLRKVEGKENKVVGVAVKSLADPGRGCRM